MDERGRRVDERLSVEGRQAHGHADDLHRATAPHLVDAEHAGDGVTRTDRAVPHEGLVGVDDAPEREVDRTQVFYMAQVSAIDSQGNLYPGYNGTANIHIQFEGSVTPQRAMGVPPLTTLPFTVI